MAGFRSLGKAFGEALSDSGQNVFQQAQVSRAAASLALAMQKARDARRSSVAVENWAKANPELADLVVGGLAQRLLYARQAQGEDLSNRHGKQLFKMAQQPEPDLRQIATLNDIRRGAQITPVSRVEGGTILRNYLSGKARPEPLAPSTIAKNMASAQSERAQGRSYDALAKKRSAIGAQTPLRDYFTGEGGTRYLVQDGQATPVTLPGGEALQAPNDDLDEAHTFWLKANPLAGFDPDATTKFLQFYINGWPKIKTGIAPASNAGAVGKSTYSSPQDVVAAVRAGTLKRDAAQRILIRQFGYSQ